MLRTWIGWRRRATARRPRGFIRALAAAAGLAAVPGTAAAVDLTGVTAARFEWTPAAGIVSAYLIYVARTGAEFPSVAEAFTGPAELYTMVQARPGDRIRVRVAAMGPQLMVGPYSQPSDEVRFVASAADLPTLDLNGDGASELVFQSGVTGALARWSELPSPNVSAIASGIAPGAVWTFVDSGDYDGDGKSDVLWVVPGSGRYVLCRSDGQSPRLCGDFALLSPTWSLVGLGDVDRDGRRDVFVRTDGGVQNFVCFGSGTALTSCGTSVGAYDPSGWAVAAPGDQNSDGSADLILHHLQTGLVYTCFVSGAGGMSCTLAASALGPGYRIVGIGDADGDGRGEVLLRNAALRVTLVCGLTNGLVAGCGALTVEGRWQLLGAGDYDADGGADVVWRDPGAGLVRIDFVSGLAAKGAPLFVPVGPSYRVLTR